MEERLILAVSSYTELYDTSSYFYRDRNKKDLAWKSVNEEIGQPVPGPSPPAAEPTGQQRRRAPRRSQDGLSEVEQAMMDLRRDLQPHHQSRLIPKKS